MKLHYKDILKHLIILFVLFLIIGCGRKESNLSIIPEPLEVEVKGDQFIFTENTKVLIDSDNPRVNDVVNYFVNQFNSVSGHSIKIINSSEKKNNLIIFTDKNLETSLGSEGYILESDKDKIVVSGTPHGLFYGVQTLFQLLPKEIYGNKKVENISWSIPSVEIKDKPRFKWRGMHLDVCRHMFPLTFIKKYIDYIAMHKLNTFHWHLTEDQGWRIEIKKYPRLTEIGAWRKGTQIEKTDQIDDQRYGGYYTQEEIKEIVKYAEERFVTVVPEIEMPGHSVAALTSYPELSCTGGPFEVRTKWGISEDIYCAGNDSVFTFLENVLTEVIELFPSKYIHIGGDEAPKERWEKCPKCQLRIKNEGLKDEHELQSYFISRMEKFLNSKGKQIIGWDEILEGGLAPNAAVMSWRGIEGGITAAKQKHNVVMTPTDYCYFDYYQGQPETEPLAIGGYLPLEKVYSYEPIPEELNSDEAKYIMGVQANQWTEYIATPELAEYMTLPRLCALAEVAWSQKEKRNLSNFLDRMGKHYSRLDELKINYFWPKVKGLTNNKVFIENIIIELVPGKFGSELYYTIDGSDPTKNSPLYKTPISLTETTLLKVREYSYDGNYSKVYKANYIKESLRKPISIKAQKKGLKYLYFEPTQQIKSTIELENLKPTKKGEIENIVFPLKDDLLPEQFGMIYKGYIEIPSDGVYTFSLLSNDGSHLYVGDKLVVDNDGLHGAYEKDGEIALQKGLHKIKVLYFQAGGGKELKVAIKSNNLERTEISKDILSH